MDRKMDWFDQAVERQMGRSIAVVPVAKVIAAIDAEEEFDGDIPQDIFDTASESPDAMAEALRVVCRLTKQGIRNRIEAMR